MSNQNAAKGQPANLHVAAPSDTDVKADLRATDAYKKALAAAKAKREAESAAVLAAGKAKLVKFVELQREYVARLELALAADTLEDFELLSAAADDIFAKKAK